MKKMLSVLTALALGSTTAATVVACGPNETPKIASWGLDAYKDKDLSIWVKKDQIQELDKTELTKLFWTGIFDADDADGDHSRQEKRFNDQEVAKHLDIVDSESIIAEIQAAEGNILIADINIKLDKDLKSTTDQKNPKEFTLKASETILKGINVIFVD